MVDINSLCLQDRNYIKLKRAGVLPRYIDCCGNMRRMVDIEELKKRVPLSSHYRTYQDYQNDRELLADMACNGQELPDDIARCPE